MLLHCLMNWLMNSHAKNTFQPLMVLSDQVSTMSRRKMDYSITITPSGQMNERELGHKSCAGYCSKCSFALLSMKPFFLPNLMSISSQSYHHFFLTFVSLFHFSLFPFFFFSFSFSSLHQAKEQRSN